MQVKKRSEIDKKYLWDINSMYGSDKAWQEDVDKALELAEGLSEYRGRRVHPRFCMSLKRKHS